MGWRGFVYFVGFDFYSTRKSLLVGLMRAYSVKLGLFFAVFAVRWIHEEWSNLMSRANELKRRKVTAEIEYFDVVFLRRSFVPACHSRFTFLISHRRWVWCWLQLDELMLSRTALPAWEASENGTWQRSSIEHAKAPECSDKWLFRLAQCCHYFWHAIHTSLAQFTGS